MASHTIFYKDQSKSEERPGSTLKTFATGKFHDVDSTPTKTIERIEFDVDHKDDTASLDVMPGAHDKVVNTSIDSTRVVEGGKEGRSMVFSSRETDFLILTEPDARSRPASSPHGADDIDFPDERHVSTRVVINFPAGAD